MGEPSAEKRKGPQLGPTLRRVLPPEHLTWSLGVDLTSRPLQNRRPRESTIQQFQQGHQRGLRIGTLPSPTRPFPFQEQMFRESLAPVTTLMSSHPPLRPGQLSVIVPGVLI